MDSDEFSKWFKTREKREETAALAQNCYKLIDFASKITLLFDDRFLFIQCNY